MEASIHPCHDFPPERARRRSSESSSPDFLREDNASRVPDGVGHEPSGTLDADFTAAEARRRTSRCGFLAWIRRPSRIHRAARSTTARAGVALGEVSHTALSRFRTYYRSARRCGRKNVRSSSARSCGSSSAAKWPPRGISLQRCTSKNLSAHSRGGVEMSFGKSAKPAGVTGFPGASSRPPPSTARRLPSRRHGKDGTRIRWCRSPGGSSRW